MAIVSQRFGGGDPKRAPTRTSALIGTLHCAAPAHSQNHDTKVCPDAGVAVSPTEVPASKTAEQVPGQAMPGGVEVTEPTPSMSTLSVGRCRRNWAVTTTGADAVRVQVVSPEHAEPKPSNVDDASAVGISKTLLPGTKLDAHIPGQSMPEGTETIRPSPVPPRTTSMVPCAGGTPAGAGAVAWTGSGARPQASTANTNAIRQPRTVMSRVEDPSTRGPRQGPRIPTTHCTTPPRSSFARNPSVWNPNASEGKEPTTYALPAVSRATPFSTSIPGQFTSVVHTWCPEGSYRAT